MGQKVHPTGFRLGVVKGWQSRWYAERDYKDVLAEDFLVRQTINRELANASVSHIEIERAAANQILVKIHTAKPGIVIGKSGEKVERLKTLLEAKTKKRVRLEIIEIRQPELDATLVGRSIAEQLEKRVSFRRAMKQAVQKSMRANAKGIKIICGGRLGGAEIARSEKEVEGKVPLQTLRADIDYGQAEAHTTFGVIGIKVWIYRGDILPDKRRELEAVSETPAPQTFTPREGGDRRGGDRRRQGDSRGPRGDRGERGERGQRPQGDRPRPQGGDRFQGERRPQGDRPERPPRGDRGERGERGQRPQGDRPRPQSGERPERPPRVQGERVERTAPPAAAAEQAAQAPATQSVASEASTPPTPPTPPPTVSGPEQQAPEQGTAQSE